MAFKFTDKYLKGFVSDADIKGIAPEVLSFQVNRLTYHSYINENDYLERYLHQHQ